MRLANFKVGLKTKGRRASETFFFLAQSVAERRERDNILQYRTKRLMRGEREGKSNSSKTLPSYFTTQRAKISFKKGYTMERWATLGTVGDRHKERFTKTDRAEKIEVLVSKSLNNKIKSFTLTPSVSLRENCPTDSIDYHMCRDCATL